MHRGGPAALGLDLGTSALKVVLVDAEGTVVRRATRGYPVGSPTPGAAETDPTLWEQAAIDAVAEVTSADAGEHEMVGLGLDGQMHGAVLTRADGRASRPAILWPDSRAGAEIERWHTLDQPARARLANPPAPGMTGPILAWLARHEPDAVRAAGSVLLPKDWLRRRLVAGDGESIGCTDPTDASATLLWDVTTDDWAHDLLDPLGVPPRLLPRVAGAASIAGGLDQEFAAACGLAPGLPVAVGCSDVAATLLGSGARAGDLLLSIGTGAQAVLPGISPARLDPATFHTYRAVEGWYAMGALLSAGLALGRVVSMLGVDWSQLYRPYDPERPLPVFVPFAAGERLPTPLAPGSAGWHDLTTATERADLLASALEGVAFAIRRVVEALPFGDRSRPRRILVAGGGARSPVFSRLLADVLGRPLHPLQRPHAAAVGAALLGFRVARYKVALADTGPVRVIEPSASEALEDRYRRFVRHVGALTAASG